ncbi:MAG: DNA -binding domain-containing protein [Bradyrhizobium sp.]
MNREHAEPPHGLPRDAAVVQVLAGYDGSDWAWEFLRRNPDYATDWRCSVPRRIPHITLSDGTKLLRLRRRFPRAERWGLYAFADPLIAARQAPVFWHGAALKQVVRVRRAPATTQKDTIPFTLSTFKTDRTAAIGVDDVPLVLMKGPGAHVAVEIHDVAVLTSSFAPVFEIDGFADLNGQTELLKRLQRFTQPAPPAAGQAASRIDERLHHALIALDESLDGKTYRQIAIAIFGEKKVAEEWLGPSQFLKDRTRRLVAKGHELMKGGYRDLLG